MSWIPKKNNELKIVLVGDSGVGKTQLIWKYGNGATVTYHTIPSVMEPYTVNIKIDDTPVKLTIWDSAGREEYDRLRPLGYQNVDCFIACYSVDSKASLDSVKQRWVPEIHRCCQDKKTKEKYRLEQLEEDIPIVLLGSKQDLRKSSTQPNDDPFVSDKEAWEVGRSFKAAGHIICSSNGQKCDMDISNVFQTVAEIAWQKRKRRKRRLLAGGIMCAVM